MWYLDITLRISVSHCLVKCRNCSLMFLLHIWYDADWLGCPRSVVNWFHSLHSHKHLVEFPQTNTSKYKGQHIIWQPLYIGGPTELLVWVLEAFLFYILRHRCIVLTKHYCNTLLFMTVDGCQWDVCENIFTGLLSQYDAFPRVCKTAWNMNIVLYTCWRKW